MHVIYDFNPAPAGGTFAAASSVNGQLFKVEMANIVNLVLS